MFEPETWKVYSLHFFSRGLRLALQKAPFAEGKQNQLPGKKMAYAVLRIAKLRSQSSVSGAVAHNHRQRPVPNADPSRNNIELVPAPTRPVAEIIKERTGKEPRSNGVLASEVVISASPEYFRPGNQGAGEWDEDRLQQWREVMEPWIERQFPHAASVVLHLDEETPHYQIIDLPLVDDGNGGLKQSHKAKYGGTSRRDIGRWQDYVAEAMRPLGIERGIFKSTARHTPQGQYHNDTAEEPSIPSVSKPPRFATDRRRHEWAVDERKRIKGIIGPAITDLADSAKGRRLAMRRAREADRQMEAKEAAIKREREAREEQARLLKEERARLRDIPLSEVLEASGWERDRNDNHQWIHPAGVANGRISVEGPKWYDHAAGRGAGGAIDLAMHLHEYPQPSGAIGWLRDNFGSDATASAYRARMNSRADRVVERAPVAYSLPESSPEDAHSVRTWLTKTRKVAKDLVDRLIASGGVYATVSGRWVNAVFPFRRGKGAEIKGTQGDFGGNDSKSSPKIDGWMWQTGSEPERLVVAESPIDALAYHQLHPGRESILASTAGAKRAAPSWLAELREGTRHLDAIVAYDNDETGRMTADGLAQSIGGRVQLPSEKDSDWADMLPEPDDTTPPTLDDDDDPMGQPPRPQPTQGTGPRME